MNKLKKMLAVLFSVLLLTACGADSESGSQSASQATQLRVAALKGPTAMGLVKWMDDVEAGSSACGNCSFTIEGSADAVTPDLMKGNIDIACLPANLAAVLYGQSEGKLVTIAVNTLGVLYIVEQGESIQSVADLKGKTIVASGKGSTPEYALRYLLEKNGLDPDTDVTMDWKTEHSECVSAIAAGTATVAMLPQPYVTVAQSKIDGLRTALDLTEQWDSVGDGSAMITGVAVANRDFAEANPEAVAEFLKEYQASVEWVNAHVEEAAELIGEYGIVEADVAKRALPECNVVCITGAEMKEKLSGYLKVLYEQDPASVGGALPDDDFYYGA